MSFGNLDLTPQDFELGEVAYNTYADARGGKSVTGQTLPSWIDQNLQIQLAWIDAAWAVVECHTNRLNSVNE